MGIFLLVVTIVLELAGAAWSYCYGSHVSAGLAGLLNDALGHVPWTAARIISMSQVCCSAGPGSLCMVSSTWRRYTDM